MAITNGYATLAQVKQRIGITDTDANRDTDLELVIGAVSRLIDMRAGRVFYTQAIATERIYTPQAACRVYVDDFTAVTSIALDETMDGTYSTALVAADYWLSPIVSYGGQWPYTYIELRPWSNHSFSVGQRNSVKITALWGWAAVPDDIREACILQSARVWARRNSPFGVIGAAEFGQPIAIGKVDPDVEAMLQPYVRLT